MRYSSTLHERYLAAVLFTAVGLAVYGCGDSATVNPVVELSRLSVSPGTLQPGFSGGTTQYNVALSSDVASVTITAQAAVAGDTVTINGQTTTNSVITLGAAGTTTPVNIVVSESGTNSRTYTVLLVRAGLAGNNSIESLTVSPGDLAPGFDANTQDYTVDVANNVGSITVTPTLSDPAATMAVNGQSTTSGQNRTITLNPPGQSTLITIVVTAQNASNKTYRITVSRGVSANRNLQSLTISSGTLSPAFSASNLDYTVNVANTVNSVTVRPTLADATATMTVNGQTANSGQTRTIQLGSPDSTTPIIIIVTAQNGTQNTYTIVVSRAALGGNNNLQGLAVSPGSLSPSFSASTTSYTVSVASTVTSLTLTPRLQDISATMTVNGQTTNSGQNRSVTLNGAGSNTLINILVTAPNGTQKTYTVGVSRAALGGNNNLQSLGISPGTLSPSFNANTTSYTVDVGSGMNSITVTPRSQDSNATMTVNNQVTSSGQNRSVTLNGPGSNTVINVVVTAPNSAQKLYTVTVSREALGGNNNLQSLAVSSGTLSPSFNANRTSYTVSVGSSVDSISVTPRLADTDATMRVNGQATTSGQARVISLNGAGSDTDINIVVTAPNSTQKIYSITVERAAPASNNNLSALSVTPGPLAPAFTQNTLNYTVNVAADVTEVTVSAIKADPNAVISGSLPNQGQATIPLTGPGTTTPISIIVTAPSGASKAYTIVIEREQPAAPPAPPARAPDLISADDSCNLKFGLPVETGTNDDCDPATLSISNRDDNFTKVTTPRFSVPQPGPGQTPNLYVDGKKVDSRFDAANNTLQPTTALSGNNDGIEHSITSTVTNTATNLESDQSDALIVTVSTGQSGV